LGTTVASLPLKTALGLSPEQKKQLDWSARAGRKEETNQNKPV
jgi:hypothetical protein